MRSQVEARAIEVLVSLVDELADDDRVTKILREAVDKLRGHPCKPHWWRLPVVGDEALVCDECGRRLDFGNITGDVRSSICNGYERRHGREAESEFSSAFGAAMEARYPRPDISVPAYLGTLPLRPRPSFHETFAQRLKRSKALLDQ